MAAAGDLSAQQWDMKAIHAPEANKKYQGSRSVTVGVLDSGIDATHPALKAAVSPSESAGCITGAADTSPASWAPTTSDHGTHVAGTIAGKDPAAGFTGIAPGVRLASVKVVNDDGYIFPESAVCGFVWAAKHGFPVTNNSYYIDPGMFFCSREPGDAAAYEAVRRAIQYSTHHGVLNVSAAGNSGFDTTDADDRPEPSAPGGLVVRHPPEGDRRGGDGVFGGLRGHEVVVQQLRFDRRDGAGWGLLADAACGRWPGLPAVDDGVRRALRLEVRDVDGFAARGGGCGFDRFPLPGAAAAAAGPGADGRGGPGEVRVGGDGVHGPGEETTRTTATAWSTPWTQSASWMSAVRGTFRDSKSLKVPLMTCQAASSAKKTGGAWAGRSRGVGGLELSEYLRPGRL